MRTLLISAFILMCVTVAAQDDETKTASKAACVPTTADIGRWRETYEKLYREYAENTSDITVNLALAEFYSDAANPMCNYATAMRHICTAEANYIDLVEKNKDHKEINRLIKKKVTVVGIRQTKEILTAQTLRLLESEKPLNEGTLDSYADAFRGNSEIILLIEKRRLQDRYQYATQANTLSALHTFINNYPGTMEAEKAAIQMGEIAAQKVAKAQRESEVDSILAMHRDIAEVQRVATARKSAIAFAILQKEPTLEGYKNFMQRYPGSDEYSMALHEIEEESRHEYAQLHTARQYADFAINNPDNILAEAAESELKRRILTERDMEALKIYMEEFPLDVNYNDIYLEYFNWHTEEGNLAPIEFFASKHPDFPYNVALEEALAKAVRFDSIDINMPFNEREFRTWASKVYHLTGKKESFVALQRTLQQFIAAKNWTKALERIRYFELSFEDNCVDEVAELTSILETPARPKLSIQPVVRPVYNMMHPVMHPDGKHLYYNKTVNGVTTIQMAEYTVTGKNAIWKSSGDIQFSNSDNRNIYIYSLYDNGEKMLVGRDGDILSATLENGMWRVERPYPQPVNSEANDFDAVMLPDGSGMLLASDRSGGQNLQPSRSYFHGDTALASDIYFVPRNGEDWGDAINLGINVNSPYMECSPTISADLKTLYFITDGRGGMGYGDIYYTTRDNADDWRKWSKPRNYGKDANSGFNEISATMTADGRTLIVSSNATGLYGCYQLESMHSVGNGMKNVTVKTPSVGIRIDIVNSETAETVVFNKEVERDTSWSTNLFDDRTYVLYGSCNGTFIPGIVFTPDSHNTLTPQVFDAKTALGINIELDALTFEANRSHLMPAATKELEHIATFMKTHPDLLAEIGVHVSGDDDTFCFSLSQARGTEIKKRLTAMGVGADRMSVAIYGNSATINGHKECASITFGQ